MIDKYLSISPYAYCNNNPLKYIDPDGKGPKDRVYYATQFVDAHIPYKQEYSKALRTENTDEGLEFMDCSEFVCRIMAKDGITSCVESHNTRDLVANVMSDDSKWIKSDTPEEGDIILWNGHTGIVESYNAETDKVTVLHATQYGELKDKNGNHVGWKVHSTIREQYKLTTYYRLKYNAYFYRPVTETPDVTNNSEQSNQTDD